MKGTLGRPRKNIRMSLCEHSRKMDTRRISSVYSFEGGYLWLDRTVAYMRSYLEDLERMLRKVHICVESSIGRVLLKAQDLYSNQG